MGKRTEHAPGTFSWVDLATTDPDGAKAFYGSLFDWDYDDLPTGDGTYTMCSIDGASVCALNAQQDEERLAGVPPHWNNYVTVADVDATTAKASELGAGVMAGPFDVMEAGRMSVIADPTGGALCLWQATGNIGAELVNVHGALTWNELHTTDVDSAIDFYKGLFGWGVQEMAGPDGRATYWVLSNGSRSNGGLMSTQPGEPSNWMPYFASDDVDRSAAAADESGGRVIAGPMDVPNGRFAVVADPQGAMFGFAGGEFDD